MIISYWTEKVFMCLGTSGKARPVLLCAIFAPSNAEVPIRARGADFSVLKLKSYRIAVPGRAWGRREMCECIDIYARCSRAHVGERCSDIQTCLCYGVLPCARGERKYRVSNMGNSRSRSVRAGGENAGSFMKSFHRAVLPCARGGDSATGRNNYQIGRFPVSFPSRGPSGTAFPSHLMCPSRVDP